MMRAVTWLERAECVVVVATWTWLRLEYWVGFDIYLDDKILKIWKFRTIEEKFRTQPVNMISRKFRILPADIFCTAQEMYNNVSTAHVRVQTYRASMSSPARGAV
jgi:hypothetical protein